MDYKGIKDKHLNVFCGFGKEHLENNITKALINTLDSLNAQQQANIYSKILGKNISSDNLKSSFYLLKKPCEKNVLAVPVQNRYIVGISPTGKCWGYTSEDIQDNDKLRHEIGDQWKEEHPEASDEEVKTVVANVLDEIHKRRENKGSVPDAWIFIQNTESRYVIIVENKLYNLDPDQINNHIEKSLLQTNKKDKNKPLYFTFKQISDALLSEGNYLTEQFAEYLTILGYLQLDSLPLACSSDEDIREELAVNAGTVVMNSIFKTGIDKRDKRTVRKTLSQRSFLQEIDLRFDCGPTKKNTVCIFLALSPKMSTAQYLYTNVELPMSFMNKHICKPYSSFHMQYNRGKNIRKSYINGEWEINDYITFWKKHLSDLKLMSTNEAATYIESLAKLGKYPAKQAKEVSLYLKQRKNPINTVPEIIYEISWSCEEISSMKDNDEFITEFKTALSEFLNSINYKVDGINNYADDILDAFPTM